ncbi:MAG: hypothetical protein Q7J60_07360, partial [Bradyrhizobium sp.]|nr:hypothetical protein [Bradyrhizobium sp.]
MGTGSVPDSIFLQQPFAPAQLVMAIFNHPQCGNTRGRPLCAEHFARISEAFEKSAAGNENDFRRLMRIRRR